MELLKREVYEDIIAELKNTYNIDKFTVETIYCYGWDADCNCPEYQDEVINRFVFDYHNLATLDEELEICEEARNPDEVSEEEYYDNIKYVASWINYRYVNIVIDDPEEFEHLCEVLS